MATSQLDSQSFKQRLLKRVSRLQLATLLMLSFIGFAGAWIAGERTTSQFFAHLSLLQKNHPWWVSCPEVSWEYLLAPTVVLFLTVLAVMKISPQPRTWSQVIVVGILLALIVRYILWRALSTLNLATPLNGVFSLVLFCMELLVIFSNSFQLYLVLKMKNRHALADRMAVAVMDGSFTPSLDILIPTYNEPKIILQRTIIGCQAIEYANKKVYLLDDKQRPEIKKLAKELGCNYLTRQDNSYAKAGNLNNAIAKTQGDIVAVFDADFVPTKNFLTRTVGFLQDQTVALVQTYQSFYNADPVARNLGLENVLPQEVEIFSRYYQILRDGIETALCYGSSFIVRRSALEEIGGFVTESLSEDYFTGVRLSAKGYRVIYLNESLSAGLSAENMADYVTQRLRWARGTLQAFFIEANPLTIPGLRFLERLAHLEGILQWFNSLWRIGFLLIPLASSFLGVNPLQATVKESIYFFLPYYLVQLFTFSWLNRRSRSALISDIYAVAQCFPISLTVIQSMLNPFSKRFKVTPKGVKRDRFAFNWTLAWPLIALFIVSAIGLWRNLATLMMGSPQTLADAQMVEGTGLVWIWSVYNLIVIGISLLILLDIPKPSINEWFDLRRVVRVNVAGQNFWGVTTMISEVGAQVKLTQAGLITGAGEKLLVTLEIIEEKLELQGHLIHTSFSDEFSTVQVVFEQVSLSQYRHLVEMLFCRPGRWKYLEAPGELQSLLLLLRTLLKPKFLFDKNREVRAIAVSNV